MARVVNHALLKLDEFSKPIVAAVNGDCAGGGVELLLCTDVHATAPHARFGLPEVKWSVYPFGGATIKLVQQIGYVHAMELLMTAGLIDAVEAARIGLVNRLVPAAELMSWALETADRIAANSPSAVQAVKRQISATIAEHARAREALDQSLGDRVRASADFQEGIAAFREKRRPHYEYRGRPPLERRGDEFPMGACFERGLCPRNRILGEASEGAAEAPSRSRIDPVLLHEEILQLLRDLICGVLGVGLDRLRPRRDDSDARRHRGALGRHA